MTKNDNKKLKEIIDLACEEAKRLGNTKVSPEHLFLGDVADGSGQGYRCSDRFGSGFL